MKTRTLLIVKPNAVEKHLTGNIISKLEENNITVFSLSTHQLSREQAEAFYLEHKGKPFYRELVDYMTSGPVVAMVLLGADCVNKVRTIVGNTDPAKADAGTLRAMYGESKGKNSVHASDSVFSADREIAFFARLTAKSFNKAA